MHVLVLVFALTDAGAQSDQHIFKSPFSYASRKGSNYTHCSSLAFTELLSATSPSTYPLSPLFWAASTHTATASLPPCHDAALKNQLCPLQVIPLAPCKLLFRLMVRVILSSSQVTHTELMWIFRPCSTEAAALSEPTCNTQGH